MIWRRLPLLFIPPEGYLGAMLFHLFIVWSEAVLLSRIEFKAYNLAAAFIRVRVKRERREKGNSCIRWAGHAVTSQETRETGRPSLIFGEEVEEREQEGHPTRSSGPASHTPSIYSLVHSPTRHTPHPPTHPPTVLSSIHPIPASISTFTHPSLSSAPIHSHPFPSSTRTPTPISATHSYTIKFCTQPLTSLPPLHPPTHPPTALSFIHPHILMLSPSRSMHLFHSFHPFLPTSSIPHAPTFTCHTFPSLTHFLNPPFFPFPYPLPLFLLYRLTPTILSIIFPTNPLPLTQATLPPSPTDVLY